MEPVTGVLITGRRIKMDSDERYVFLEIIDRQDKVIKLQEKQIKLLEKSLMRAEIALASIWGN